jgi:hypothetical protein
MPSSSACTAAVLREATGTHEARQFDVFAPLFSYPLLDQRCYVSCEDRGDLSH